MELSNTRSLKTDKSCFSGDMGTKPDSSTEEDEVENVHADKILMDFAVSDREE